MALLAKNHTTYDIGLIQAKGYRVLKQLSASVLKPEGLTTLERAIMGILRRAKTGVRASEIAKELGVQPPLVSRIIVRMEKNKWIHVSLGEDRRERVITLTEKSKRDMVRIEKLVRAAMRPMLVGIATRDLVGYLRTLASLSENCKNAPTGSLTDYIPDD